MKLSGWARVWMVAITAALVGAGSTYLIVGRMSDAKLREFRALCEGMPSPFKAFEIPLHEKLPPLDSTGSALDRTERVLQETVSTAQYHNKVEALRALCATSGG